MPFPVVQFELFGLTVYGFGLALALGGLLALLLLHRDRRRAGMTTGSAPRLMLPAILLGLVGARLVYCVFNYRRVFFDAVEGHWLGLGPFFRLGQGGLSLYGLLAGVLLACCLYARFHRQSAGRVLDWAALPLGVFAGIALLAQILGGTSYGEEVLAEGLQFFPIAVRNDYEEWNLAVFAWQGIAVLAAALSLLRPAKGTARPGDRMLRLLIPLCALQLFFEALRQDDYPRLESNAFIRVNQVLALAFLIVTAIMLTRRLGTRHALPVWGMLALAAGAAIAAEFNEKLPMARELLYALSLAAQIALAAVMLHALRRDTAARHHPEGTT
ncbi:MAG: prolipoprotein diacylglyceryl transferase [Clostridiales bacterium]|nr:prolipoprotein diacylglyceryl transferase [Clostridiales bacterium]